MTAAVSASADAATVIVQLRNVRKQYGPMVALDDVSLTIRSGEVHCLAGENGAGKSTLIKILSGAVARDSGDYDICGVQQPYFISPAHSRAAGVAVVYQELSLLPELSVADNLVLGRMPSRFGLVSKRDQRRQSLNMLATVGLSDVPLNTPVKHLPTATRQLIEIARVAGSDVRLVVFDEPTTALSELEAQVLLVRIRKMRDSGTAVLYVTHRLEEMFQIGDRVTVLRDGKSVATHQLSDLDENSLIATMVGREVTNLYPGHRPKPGLVRLDLRDVVPQAFPAPLSLTVRQGEIVGLAGLLGAGRSEILHSIFGSQPLVRGTVLVDGKKVDVSSPRAAMRSGIAMLTEDRKESGVLALRSIEENVTIGSLSDCARGGIVSSARQRARAQSSVNGLRLKYGSWTDLITSLSGGNQQKVLLGRWLGAGAKVLLLDEPTKGVDIGAKSDLYRVIAGFAEDGLAVIVVSSYLPELLGLCDRVIVVSERRIAGELSGADATEHKVLELASPRRLRQAVTASLPLNSHRPVISSEALES